MNISPDSPMLSLISKRFTGVCIYCDKEFARIKIPSCNIVVKVPYVTYNKGLRSQQETFKEEKEKESKKNKKRKEWREKNLSYVTLEKNSKVRVVILNAKGHKLYGMIV